MNGYMNEKESGVLSGVLDLDQVGLGVLEVEC